MDFYKNYFLLPIIIDTLACVFSWIKCNNSYGTEVLIYKVFLREMSVHYVSRHEHATNFSDRKKREKTQKIAFMIFFFFYYNKKIGFPMRNYKINPSCQFCRNEIHKI